VLSIDERLGRRHAQRVGLPVTGSLGILLKAKELGKIDAVEPLIESLQLKGIRLSEVLVDQVLKLAHEK